jgi:hypothetical protein
MQASILKLKATLRSLKTLSPYVGFEVIKAMVMKNYIFWDMTPCSPRCRWVDNIKMDFREIEWDDMDCLE